MFLFLEMALLHNVSVIIIVFLGYVYAKMKNITLEKFKVEKQFICAKIDNQPLLLFGSRRVEVVIILASQGKWTDMTQ